MLYIGIITCLLDYGGIVEFGKKIIKVLFKVNSATEIIATKGINPRNLLKQLDLR